MDSNRLGEALSLTAWATAVVLSVAALLACWFDWRELGDIFFFRSLLSAECMMETVLGGVNSLENQIRYFNRTRQGIISNIGIRYAKKLLAGAIYIVATGGNDVASSIPRRNSSSDDGLASLDLRLDTILSTLRSQLTKPYKLGARKLVVVNSPPGGCIPFAIERRAFQARWLCSS
ncbi:hypothetical protein Peur_004751 [Populus x canadensis]